MTSLFENLNMKGGGNRKPGCPNDVHFKLHKISKGRSQKHSLFGLNLLTPPKIYEKVDLWIEWPNIPDNNIDDWTTWINNLISFMNTFKTETIVLRFGYNPSSGSNWPPLTSTSTDYDNYYNNWITRYKSYEINTEGYSIKQILDKTSVKTVYFLPDSAPGDITGYKHGIHYLNYLLTPITGKWRYFNTKVKTGICIEVEAFITNTDTTYATDTLANPVAKKISYLLKNYSSNLFTQINIKTELGATNLTLDNDLVLAATGTQTQGKSINRIVDSSGKLIINRYFGQCYNMGGLPLTQPPTTTQFNSQGNQSVINYLYDCVKLVDTDKSNYWVMLSLETDKLRKLNSNRTGWQTPKPITKQLGLLYQGKWQVFNELINQLKSPSTKAKKVLPSGESGVTNVNGFSGYFTGLCPNPNNCSSADPTTTDQSTGTTFSNVPLKNIMVYSSDFIEQISNPSTDLTSKISPVNYPLF